MSFIRKHYQKAILLIVSAGILLLALWPLFHVGFPANHDGNLYLNWLYEFDQGIKDGQLQPRWAPDVWLGYGSPVFNFVQPGFYYLAEGFHLTGLNLINSVKATIILAVVLGYLFMYLFSRTLWKNNWAALLSATLFTWSPYHLGSIYLRGSLAELLAMAWWPLILFGLYRFVATLRLRNLLITAFGTAALMLSHNVLTIIFLPVAGAYLLIIAWRRWRVITVSLVSMLLGAAWSAWFWLPAFIEKKYLNVELLFTGNRNYSDNFINLVQIISTEWKNYVFLIGLTGLVLIALALYTLLEAKGRRHEYGRRIWFWLAIFTVAVFMSSYSSCFIWEGIPFLRYFQFPWRWLALASLTTAVLGGAIVLYHKSIHKYSAPIILSLGLIILTLIINSSYAYPEGYYRNLPDAEYRPFREREKQIQESVRSGNKTIQVFFFSEMPEFFSKQTSLIGLEKLLEKKLSEYTIALGQSDDATIDIPPKIEKVQGDVEILDAKINSARYQFELLAKEDSVMQINSLWFPGWTATLDGKKIPIEIWSDLGIMRVEIPQGTHNLDIVFKNTTSRQIGNMVSLAGLIIMVILAVFIKHINQFVNKSTKDILLQKNLDK
ncbi:MAG: 6-pyruvoyl-tetrahydropterin synthase-related protein [Patescibacteria group bacterium]|nr:6-pyruvoyl-tetrahydropterin synthase-related protein [Patescibacteria group bacterium]